MALLTISPARTLFLFGDTFCLLEGTVDVECEGGVDNARGMFIYCG